MKLKIPKLDLNPNQHGVYENAMAIPVCSDFKKAGLIEIRLARTSKGFISAISILTTLGGVGSMPSIYDRAFNTADKAIKHSIAIAKYWLNHNKDLNKGNKWQALEKSLDVKFEFEGDSIQLELNL